MVPTTTEFVVDDFIAALKEKTGSDGVGYWKFFAQQDAPELILKHVSGGLVLHVSSLSFSDASFLLRKIDSFLQLGYAQTPEDWLVGLCPVGGLRAWLEADRQPGRPE